MLQISLGHWFESGSRDYFLHFASSEETAWKKKFAPGEARTHDLQITPCLDSLWDWRAADCATEAWEPLNHNFTMIQNGMFEV